MQKTQQSALIQQTNQGLVAIRSWEISYYSSFYYSFGSQSAVIGGFAYAALTQVTFPYRTPYDDDLSKYPLDNYILVKELFWFFSAMCLAASMHVVLTTILVQIMGPRLALYGAIGSMVKAANGMREEINEIFVGFVLMIVFFSLSTLMSFWVLMSIEAAIASSVVFVISSTRWWKNCSRIYNRFYYEPLSHRFDDNMSDSAASSDLGSDRHDSTADSKIPPSKSWKSYLFARKSKSKSESEEVPKAKKRRPTHKRTTTQDMIDHQCSGYVCLSEEGKTKAFSFGARGADSTAWVRRYLYLTGSGNLYTYKSKLDYPANPVRDRPIEVWDYEIEVVREAAPQSDSSASTAADSTLDLVLEIKLIHAEGRNWVLRFDTVFELEEWAEGLLGVKGRKLGLTLADGGQSKSERTI